MCKSGFEFWRNVRYETLFQIASAVGTEVVTANRNPNRVGFLILSGNAQTVVSVRLNGTSNRVCLWDGANLRFATPLRIDYYGQVMFEEWTFALITAAQAYQIVQLILPAEYR